MQAQQVLPLVQSGQLVSGEVQRVEERHELSVVDTRETLRERRERDEEGGGERGYRGCASVFTH